MPVSPIRRAPGPHSRVRCSSAAPIAARHGARGLLAIASAIASLTVPHAAQASVADAARGYELVSPAGIGGARRLLDLPTTGPWSSPIGPGGRVLYRMTSAVPNDPPGDVNQSLLRADRTTSGWQQTNVDVPASTLQYDLSTFIAASADLSTVAQVVQAQRPFPDEQLLPGIMPAGGSYLFQRRAGQTTWLTQGAGPRDAVGDPSANLLTDRSAYSADGSVVAFTDPVSLLPIIAPRLAKDQVYVSRDGVLEAPAIRADGTLITTGASVAGMSADGRSLLYLDAAAPLAGGGTATDLLLRTPSGVVQVNRSRRTSGGPRVGATRPTWITLTPDGQTVLFTTAEQLVDGDSDTSSDLYRYDVRTDALTQLSRGSGGAPGGNSSTCTTPIPSSSGCGTSVGLPSRDGQTVYFFSPEQLDGASGTPGRPALYVVRGDAPPKLVSSFGAADAWIGTAQSLSRTAWQVTNAGDLFLETKNLGSAAQTGGRTQVWGYAATAGTLRCLSCRISGGTPTGSTTLSSDSTEGRGERGTALLPVTPPSGGSRRVTADGSTVFVTSYDRLVPDDRDSAADVYAIDTATGRPHLLTTGTSGADSYLMGSDDDGSNVYFATTSTLDPRDDLGPASKLYDARIGGGGAPAPAIGEACADSSCRTLLTPPTAPQVATQSSTPDASAPPADPGVTLLPPTAAARARLATSGRLTVTVRGLTPGSIVALRVRVALRSGSTVSARAVSRSGPAQRSITARFSVSQRRAIAAARRQRTLAVELRADPGGEDPALLSTSISRLRKGR